MSSPSTTDIPATSNTAPEATARPWSYEIQYGSNGEEIYAWVHYHNLMVCTVKVHHARMIVQAVNAYEPLKARLAEVEREFERTQFARDAAGFIGTAAECIEFLNAQNLTAEARIAVLEKALAEVLDMYFPMSGPTAVKQPPLILEARTALAEQKGTVE